MTHGQSAQAGEIRLPAVIDLSMGQAEVSAAMRRACEHSGFFYLINHGVPAPDLAAVFEANRAFHALPLEEKLAVRLNRHFRGYQPIGGSTLKLSTVERASRPNQSESFFTRHVAPSSAGGRCPIDGPNQWPARPPGFEAVVERYMGHMNDLGLRLARLAAVALEEPVDAFVERFFARPSLALRLLHYPPVPVHEEGLYGIAPHTDYGFFTILAQDDAGGLEIGGPDKAWHPVPPLAGAFVINIGNALSLMTNGRFVSTAHRVINAAPDRARYSVPCFFDPCLDARVEVLRAFDDGSKPAVMDFGEYFHSRLAANFDYREDPC